MNLLTAVRGKEQLATISNLRDDDLPTAVLTWTLGADTVVMALTATARFPVRTRQ